MGVCLSACLFVHLSSNPRWHQNQRSINYGVAANSLRYSHMCPIDDSPSVRLSLQEKLVRARVELVFYRDAATSIAKSAREAGVAEQLTKQRDDNSSGDSDVNDSYKLIPTSCTQRDAEEMKGIGGHDSLLERLHAAVAVQVSALRSNKQEVDSSYCALLLLKEQTEEIEGEVKELKARLAVTARENERALKSISNPSAAGTEHGYTSRRPSVSTCHSPRTLVLSTPVHLDNTYPSSSPTPVLTPLADPPLLSVTDRERERGAVTPVTCVTQNPNRSGGFPCLSPLRISRTASLRGELLISE